MAVVGRIARAHGIRGEVVVNVETDFPHERFRPGAELYVKQGPGVKVLVLATVRFHHERPVMALDGVEDMNAAMALAGTELRVPVERLMPLPGGTFYRHDLVGCGVETRNGERIGVVTNVEGTLGRSRLVVETSGGEALIPLVEAICIAIAPADKRIVIDPPEGLLELNTGMAKRKS